jgi:23S rRNA pseudouridine1911/1915/1917 synthase
MSERTLPNDHDEPAQPPAASSRDARPARDSQTEAPMPARDPAASPERDAGASTSGGPANLPSSACDAGPTDPAGATTRLVCIAELADVGARADVVLGRRIAGLSRRVARELALAGHLTVDGRRVPPSHRVGAGERLELDAPAAPVVAVEGPELLAATDAIVYVVKPAGLHTHRLRPGDPPALADWVAERFSECVAAGLDPREGGAVHRLDRGTSGVVAFARTRAAFLAARDAFTAALVGKHYMAVTTCPFNHVWPPPAGPWSSPLGSVVEVSAPLGPGVGRDRVAVRETGQPARTRIEPHSLPGPRRLWSLELLTGRRHQARVHLAWLGLPILGD